MLVGEHTLKEAVQRPRSRGSTSCVRADPAQPVRAAAHHAVQALLAELAGLYDQVLFDSPPLAAVTDAAVIAPQVDGVILVVHGQRTTRDALRSALRQLHDVGSHIIGGVLNDVDLSARYLRLLPTGSYYTEEQLIRGTAAVVADRTAASGR